MHTRGVSVRAGAALLLDDVTLEVRAGEVVALVGENGAGKTTLLDVLAGLRRPDEGAVEVRGQPLLSLPPRERARKVASLDQEDAAAPELSVEARIGHGLVPRRGASSLLDDDARARIARVAEELGVAELSTRRLRELSGGERRRVEVARALVDDEVPCVLLDEPHAGIDVRNQPIVSAALRRRASEGAALVVSVHDLTVALRLAHRVVGIKEGRLVVDAPVDDAFTPENLRALYGVEGDVVTTSAGHRAVVLAGQAGLSPRP
jgi:iron complex transport system ATP-binding protein